MINLYSIVLAAGKGTRMKSKLPKVLHQVAGKPMIGHIVQYLQAIHSKEIVMVVGYKAEEVKEYLDNQVTYVHQEQQFGTGHAVLQAQPILKEKKGITLVVTGDTPLLTLDTLTNLIEEHKNSNAAATVLTTKLTLPAGYGRIVRDKKGNVMKIVEEKDTSAEEKLINEINSGIYCFDNEKLFNALAHVTNNNEQSEYYLPDVIEILQTQGEMVTAFQTKNSVEIMGINDRIALAEADKIMRKRILEKHMLNGVTIIDPDNTYIESDVHIEQDTIIYPGSYLKGKTSIESDCSIGPNANLTDVHVGNNVSIINTVAISATIDEKAIIGPFAYIRPGSHIGASVKIGDFVEIKNSAIGKETKVPHHAYIGDSTLGEGVNIGCGTITVNYDGFNKHRTEIGDRSFIGCNTNLIAPVQIGKDAYIAAGSTITDFVPDFSLAIARERQVNKEGYVKKIRQTKG